MGTAFSCCKNAIYTICKLPFYLFNNEDEVPYTKTKNAFSNLPVIPEKPELENQAFSQTIDCEEVQSNSIGIEMVNINKDHTHLEGYSDLIEEGKSAINTLKEKLKEGIEGYEEVYKENEKEHNLKIFMKSYKNADGYQIGIYRSEYEVPCSAKSFLEFLNEFETQKSLTKNYDDYKIIDSFHKNFCLYYICYSKSLITSARDFVYIKHHMQEGNVFYDVSRSIELPEEYPVTDKIVRGEIILAGYEIQNLGEERCSVRLYSENDFKFKMAPGLIKKMAVKEMKSYVEQSIEKIKENKVREENWI